MAWKALDRATPQHDTEGAPTLNEAVREKIRSLFPRYETKRAALLPALHIAQESAAYLSPSVLVEVAEVLELPPSQVLDVVTFYTHHWTHPRGRKVVMVCRSITCELMGGREVIEAVKQTLGIDEHETTPDGEYSLITEECLAGCDHAPCMLVGEKLYKCVKPEDVPRILADPDNDKIDGPRSELYDGIPSGGNGSPSDRGADEGAAAQADSGDEGDDGG